MGGYLDKPKTDGCSECGESKKQSIRFGSYSMQGHRPKMEDESLVKMDIEDRSEYIEGIFGVFDGHGGREVASYAKRHFYNAMRTLYSYRHGEDLGTCLQETLVRLDVSLLTKGKEELNKLADRDELVVCVHKDICKILSEQHRMKKEENDDVEDEDNNEEATKFALSENGQDGSIMYTNMGRKRKASSCSTNSGDSDGTSSTSSDETFNAQPPSKRVRIGDETGLNKNHVVWEKIRQIGEKRGLHKEPLNLEGSLTSSGVGIEVLSKRKSLKYANNPNMLLIEKKELIKRDPGVDSGCTALLSAIETIDNDTKALTVVNCGDSRCVLSRNGVAIPLSVDHSPNLATEKQRIEAAGGVINKDGRINGKLNLSRAIGDHQFKQNRTLPLYKQIVTPFGEIQKTEIKRGQDEFVVLACDGIWDVMSSQQVVDFVRERRVKNMPLHEICHQLCLHCLAKDVQTDPGTDNMTVLVVELF